MNRALFIVCDFSCTVHISTHILLSNPQPVFISTTKVHQLIFCVAVPVMVMCGYEADTARLLDAVGLSSWEGEDGFEQSWAAISAGEMNARV